jgi:tetratricopeptide (TPR) repeat protein
MRTVSVRRHDPMPTVAAAIIFMGLWLVALLVGFGAAGIYQGLQDREHVALDTAEEHKGRAKAYINEGNLELAFEELQYARRFNPKDPEIARLLSTLQRQRAPATPGQAIATPTLGQVSQRDILGPVFDEGKAAFDAKDYEKATSVLDGLRRVQPDFRKTEVEDMLYTAHLALARSFLAEKRYEEAVQRFDKALAIRKDDHLQLERYLASLYFRGLSASGADWKRAVESFAEIVRINPEYEDASARLYQSYLAYGEYLLARGNPCLAVDQFAAALSMYNTSANQGKYSAAAGACASGGGVVSTPRPGVTPPAGSPSTPAPVPGARYRAVVNPNLQGTTDDTGSIRGQVRDKNGQPVRELEMLVVSATKNYQRTETTDDFGFFGFDGLEPDQYTVRVKNDPASASGVVNAARRLRVLIDFLQN